MDKKLRSKIKILNETMKTKNSSKCGARSNILTLGRNVKEEQFLLNVKKNI